MLLRVLAGVLPLAVVLGFAAREIEQMAPAVRGLQAAVDSLQDCANERVERIAAIADGADPQPDATGRRSVRLPLSRGVFVAQVAYDTAEHCGSTGARTLVRFSDGSSTAFPGRGMLVRTAPDAAEFLLP